jgi:hypothetical protein
VADPATAVPNHPKIGERNAKKIPVVASAAPIALVWPDIFITYASPITKQIVRIEIFKVEIVLKRAAIPFPKVMGKRPPELVLP